MSIQAERVYGAESMNVVTAPVKYLRKKLGDVLGGEARAWRQEMKRQHQESVYATRKMVDGATGNFVEDKIFPPQPVRKRKGV